MSDSVVPNFTALLPIATDDIHPWINSSAKMDICHPIWGGGTYSEITETVYGNAGIFVVSPKDIQLRAQFLLERNEYLQKIEDAKLKNESNMGWLTIGNPVGLI